MWSDAASSAVVAVAEAPAGDGDVRVVPPPVVLVDGFDAVSRLPRREIEARRARRKAVLRTNLRRFFKTVLLGALSVSVVIVSRPEKS